MNQVHLGTQIKLNIHIDPISSLTMDDYEFEAEFFCGSTRLKALKNEMIKVDSDNYIALVDTSKLGAGKLRCKVTARIPDTDFSDGLRTEVVDLDTGIEIYRGI